MKAYKLTDKNDKTYGGCQWGENIEHKVKGEGNLCTNGWIHFYKNPLLAVLLNPIHGDYNLETAHLWECSVSGRTKEDRGLKWGASRVKTIKRVKLPKITKGKRVKFGILCALEVYHEKSFVEWAKSWLSDKDKTKKSAYAAIAAAADAAAAAYDAAAAAYDAAAYAAVDAAVAYAIAAADAAVAAADAAAADAAVAAADAAAADAAAAYAAVDAAVAYADAADAAYAAADAATYAATDAKDIDLNKIAAEAIK